MQVPNWVYLVNMQNEEGWTALHVAAEQGMVRMVRYLLARGADANIKTTRGRTAYDVAAGYSEVQSFLKAEMARRRRKEHEADEIGFCLQRGIERGGRLEAADFHEGRHLRQVLARGDGLVFPQGLMPSNPSRSAWPPRDPRVRCQPT